MKSSDLQDSDLDGLREIGNIGAGNAATALSQLLREVVTLEVPEVRTLELRDLPASLGGPDRVLVAVHLRILGDLRGDLLLTLPTAGAASLLRRMGLEAPDLHELPPLAESALREVGQILSSTYLNAVSHVLERNLVPSVPGLAVDFAGAVVDLLPIQLAGISERALVLETAFRESGGPIRGHFFLVPDPEGIHLLLRGVRRRHG
ncbi:MAG: chemotaxis protein CheC [Acidobacteriota bacterium]